MKILIFIIAFSFLPLLYIPNLDLGLQPNGLLSVVFILLTFNLAILGMNMAKRRQVLQLYSIKQ